MSASDRNGGRSTAPYMSRCPRGSNISIVGHHRRAPGPTDDVPGWMRTAPAGGPERIRRMGSPPACRSMVSSVVRLCARAAPGPAMRTRGVGRRWPPCPRAPRRRGAARPRAGRPGDRWLEPAAHVGGCCGPTAPGVGSDSVGTHGTRRRPRAPAGRHRSATDGRPAPSPRPVQCVHPRGRRPPRPAVGAGIGSDDRERALHDPLRLPRAGSSCQPGQEQCRCAQEQHTQQRQTSEARRVVGLGVRRGHAVGRRGRQRHADVRDIVTAFGDRAPLADIGIVARRD